MATEETTITELELAEEVLADMVIPVDTSTDTKSVSLKQLRAWLGSSLPTGFIIASFGKMDDERFTLLDGKTLSKQGTYGAFCAKVEAQVQAGKWYACSEEEYNADLLASGQCSKFVIGVDYVRIPKLGNSLCSGVVDGKIPVVGNGMTLGLTNGDQTAGLSYGANGGAGILVALYDKNVGTQGSSITGTPGTVFGAGVTTDPTKSGIEAKINSVEVFYYMVISTEGQTASVEIDINKVYEDLNIKANSDLSNVASVAQSFKEQSIGWGIPDYSAAVSAPSKNTVAPMDIYVKSDSPTSATSTIYVNDILVASGWEGFACAYVPKGATFRVSGKNCKYYPLKGVN